jgi:hypothetical protein
VRPAVQCLRWAYLVRAVHGVRSFRAKRRLRPPFCSASPACGARRDQRTLTPRVPRWKGNDSAEDAADAANEAMDGVAVADAGAARGLATAARAVEGGWL